jgi:hypothetical protein
VGRLEELGERDGWRCWLCDQPVDPTRSVNDDRGPSADSRITKARAKTTGKSGKAVPVPERLAHRACNTRKGAVDAVIPWPEHLFVVDPAPIITSVERLSRKGGREVMARCPTRADGEAAAAWLLDRLSRLEPGLAVTAAVEAGGSQFVVLLRA